MTSLTQSTQIVKNFAGVVLASLVIIILIAVIFLNFSKSKNTPTIGTVIPSPPAIYQDPSQKEPQVINLSQTSTPAIPTELPVYMAQTYNLTDKNYADLALSFGINNPPFLIEEKTTEGKQINWMQNKIYLTASQNSLRFENQNQNKEELSLSEDQLKQKAFDFIQKIPVLDKDLTLRKTNYLSLQTRVYASAASYNDAQVLEFIYDKKLSGYPLYNDSPDTSYVTLRITKGGNVTFLSTKLIQGFTKLNSYKLIAKDVAIKDIKNGQGKIVQTLIPDQNGQALEEFRARPQSLNLVDINSLTIAYFLPNDISEPIQPIFVAEGQSQNNQSEVGKVYIYLPA